MSYNKRIWANGDLITKEFMNNIEDGIYDAHDKIEGAINDFSSQIKDIKNVKADKTTTDNIQQQVNNLVLGAVGDGNNAEVVQARGSHETLNDRLTDNENVINKLKQGDIEYSIIEEVKTYAGYVRSADYSIIKGDPNYVYTDYIPIDSNNNISYTVYGQKEVYIISFYDETYNFISGVSTDKSFGTLSSGIVTPPKNAHYAIFCWANSLNQGATTVTDSFINICVNTKKEINIIKNDVKELKEEFIKEEDLLLNVPLTFGYMGLDGVVVEGDTNWVTSDYIDIHLLLSFAVTYVSHKLVAFVTFYDENKTKIGHLESRDNGNIYTRTVQVPSEAYYIRVSSSSENYEHYTPLKVVYRRNTSLLDLETQIYNVKNEVLKLTSNTLNLIENSKIGYLHVDGFTITVNDKNWFYTDYIKVAKGDILEVSIKGHKAVGSICIYNENKELISAENNELGGMINSTIILTEPGYIRISGGSETYASAKPKAILISSIQNTIDGIQKDIEKLQQGIINKQDINYIFPYKIYTTCNDIGGKKGHNRNYASAIYLDHFFNGFTEEKNIRFKNGVDKVVFHSPITVTDSNEANPAVKWNNGVNILTQTKEIGIHGDDIIDSNFTVTHVSTLNSVTRNVTPRVLCIGDSITYAELAQINDDNHSQNWAYHLMCKELFMKDNIDNGNSGYDIKFLGHYQKKRKMSYKDVEYDVVTYHEGIRGISLNAYLNGNVSDFKDITTNKFSLNAWLSKYRTLDDNGNRLTLGDGTGTAITSSNINSIDVCTPTHVLIMLGANGGGTLDQYKELVNIIKTEYPNMIIGIAIPDAAGTYFPSLHPNCDEKMTIWNDTGSQGSRHNQQYKLVKMLQEEFCNDTYENQNIYFVPFYFVQPTAESCSMRKVNLPDADIQLTHDNLFNASYGWHASTHVNGIGHINWGYQLYSWIKYTIAKNI